MKAGYYIPIIIGLLLMLLSINHNSVIYLNYEVNTTKPLFFSNDSIIKTIALRPDWVINLNAITDKPVRIAVLNLDGVVINESGSNHITFSPSIYGIYLFKIIGSDYSLISFNYRIKGMVPYAPPYLLFSSGLIIVLLTVIYYLIKPLTFKFKRSLTRTDALFYSLSFLLSSIVLGVFRDSFIQAVPRTVNDVVLISLSIIVIIILILIFIKLLVNDYFKRLSKSKRFFMVFANYLLSYACLFLTVIINLTMIQSWVAKLLSIILLTVVYYKFNIKTGLVVYLLTLLSSLVINVMAFAVGIPVFFDNLLSVPSSAGALVLLLIIELFVIMSVYFIVRGYYAHSISRAVSYGLYASVMIQAIIQIFTATSIV